MKAEQQVVTGWVVDCTNRRGNEVYERAIVGPLPRKLAEAHVAHLKAQNPQNYYGVREIKD